MILTFNLLELVLWPHVCPSLEDTSHVLKGRAAVGWHVLLCLVEALGFDIQGGH